MERSFDYPVSDSRLVTPLYFQAMARLHLLYDNWCARLAVARLERLPNGLLEDVGLSRSDVRWALGLPLTINCEKALFNRAHCAGRR